MSVFSSYIGLPYEDKGRIREGIDCWGLVRLIYQEQLKIELPSYSENYVSSVDRQSVNKLVEEASIPWLEISKGKERQFDVLLIKHVGFSRHVGIVISPSRGLMIHIVSGETSVVERYKDGTISHRIVGFFRYRDHE